MVVVVGAVTMGTRLVVVVGTGPRSAAGRAGGNEGVHSAWEQPRTCSRPTDNEERVAPPGAIGGNRKACSWPGSNARRAACLGATKVCSLPGSSGGRATCRGEVGSVQPCRSKGSTWKRTHRRRTPWRKQDRSARRNAASEGMKGGFRFRLWGQHFRFC